MKGLPLSWKMMSVLLGLLIYASAAHGKILSAAGSAQDDKEWSAEGSDETPSVNAFIVGLNFPTEPKSNLETLIENTLNAAKEDLEKDKNVKYADAVAICARDKKIPSFGKWEMNCLRYTDIKISSDLPSDEGTRFPISPTSFVLPVEEGEEFGKSILYGTKEGQCTDEIDDLEKFIQLINDTIIQLRRNGKRGLVRYDAEVSLNIKFYLYADVKYECKSEDLTVEPNQATQIRFEQVQR